MMIGRLLCTVGLHAWDRRGAPGVHDPQVRSCRRCGRMETWVGSWMKMW